MPEHCPSYAKQKNARGSNPCVFQLECKNPSLSSLYINSPDYVK
uniref:Uncharacterized protein n=1 Tax=virus sp. ctd0M1 TaxID=2827993 RepID=A0A8S5RDL5_9VIRU|nr:MAG TPA: hypothetical protein [virus sp. ctd0M1]